MTEPTEEDFAAAREVANEPHTAREFREMVQNIAQALAKARAEGFEKGRQSVFAEEAFDDACD